MGGLWGVVRQKREGCSRGCEEVRDTEGGHRDVGALEVGVRVYKGTLYVLQSDISLPY